MAEHQSLPEARRVSVLTAILLLAMALAHFLKAGETVLTIPLFGVELNIPVSLNIAISILAAALAAAGMDWLLRTHPMLEKGETREHWLLPTLTTLVLAVTLTTLTDRVWWLGFGLGMLLLVMVFVAEYIVVDHTDIRYPLATAILTALAFAIFLILAISLRASGGRLFLIAPALFLGGFLAALRTLHLRLGERWEPGWAIGIGLVGMQLGAALHYFPISPVRYGLVLLGPVYALTLLGVSLADGISFRRAAAEPGVMLILFWGLLAWFG